MEGQRYYYYALDEVPFAARKATAQIRVRRTADGARTDIFFRGKKIGTAHFVRVGKARLLGGPVLRSHGIFINPKYMGKGLMQKAMIGTFRHFKNTWFVADTNVSRKGQKLYRNLVRSPHVATTRAARFRSCHKTATWRWQKPVKDGYWPMDWHGWYPVGYARYQTRIHPACKLAFRWKG